MNWNMNLGHGTVTLLLVTALVFYVLMNFVDTKYQEKPTPLKKILGTILLNLALISLLAALTVYCLKFLNRFIRSYTYYGTQADVVGGLMNWYMFSTITLTIFSICVLVFVGYLNQKNPTKLKEKIAELVLYVFLATSIFATLGYAIQFIKKHFL